MRKFTLLFGIALLLTGIISEAMYITTTRVAYQDAIVANTYLVLGILAIVVGFIFTLTSVKIPKVRVP